MKRELSIDFIQCFRVLFKNWWIILIITIITTTIGVFMTMDKGINYYTAKTTVYSIAYGSVDLANDGVYAMQTYAPLIVSNKVTNRAAALIGKSNITGEYIKSIISYILGSDAKVNNMISIMAVSSDYTLSLEVANAVAAAFIYEINNITAQDNVQVMDEAEITNVMNTISSNKNRTRVIAAAIGFFLPCLFIVAKVIFSTKILTVRDIMYEEKIPVIGVIPDSQEIRR